MSLHHVVVDGRKRLQISQSKTEPGKVLVQLLDSARDVLLTFSMDAPTAGLVSMALEIEGTAAEKNAETLAALLKTAAGEQAAPGVCMCYAAAGIRGFNPACTCKKTGAENFRIGGTVITALPVVDVAQVGA